MKTIYIGRAADNDIVLQDTLVSSKHLRIMRDETGSFFAEDLQSTNGTWIDNEPLRGASRRIELNTIVRVGETVLAWQMYFLAAEPPPPVVELHKQEPAPKQETKQMPPRRDALPEDTWERNLSRVIWGLLIAGGSIVLLLLLWYFGFVRRP